MSFQIDKNLKTGSLSGAILLFGEERYLVNFYVNAIIEKFVDPQFADFNVTRIDKFESLGAIKDVCETYPMFGEHRVVIINESNLFKAKASSKADSTETDDDAELKKKAKSEKSDNEEFERFVTEIPEYSIVIFVEKAVNATKKTFKSISKYGLAQEFPVSSEALLLGWTAKQFAKRGKRITKQALETMIAFSSFSMTELLNQVEQISTYALDREEVQLDDVLAICKKEPKAVVFDITDALGERNATKAYRCLEEVLAQNEPIQKVIILLCNHMNRIRALKKLLDEGCNYEDAYKLAGFKSSYAAGKARNQARMFSFDRLDKLTSLALDLDVGLKTSRFKDEMVLGLFIAVCTNK